MRESADRFEQRGDNVFLEMQNWFETRSSRTVGKPDIIGQQPDGSARCTTSRLANPGPRTRSR